MGISPSKVAATPVANTAPLPSKNNIANVPVGKEKSVPKKHLEEFCLLARPFVAFGRFMCEIWISFLEAIKNLAKAIGTSVASLFPAQHEKKRSLETPKSNHPPVSEIGASSHARVRLSV